MLSGSKSAQKPLNGRNHFFTFNWTQVFHIDESMVLHFNKLTYSMSYSNSIPLTVKYSFDHLNCFSFTERMVFPALLLLTVVFVYTHGIYSEPQYISLGQKNNPNANFAVRQCFAAIFERWQCFAIKSAAHTSSLNEVLISHFSIQMHFYFHLYLSAYTLRQTKRGTSLLSFWLPKTILSHNTDV